MEVEAAYPQVRDEHGREVPVALQGEAGEFSRADGTSVQFHYGPHSGTSGPPPGGGCGSVSQMTGWGPDDKGSWGCAKAGVGLLKGGGGAPRLAWGC
ncbi:hypothetical protein GCM10028793_25460 [Nocardiopsis oceani]